MTQIEPTIVWHEHDCRCPVCQQPPVVTMFTPTGGVQWLKALPIVVTHMRREQPQTQRTGDEVV